MPKVLMVKKLSSLYPADEAAEEALRRLGQGEMVMVEIKRPRKLRFHRKFFAMLQIILKNQEHYKSIEDLLDVCKLAVGHCRTVRTRYGDVKIPESISFASMSEDDFAAFYDRAVNWILSEVIPGLQRRHLDEEVEATLLKFGE